jgi:hypothetical protein
LRAAEAEMARQPVRLDWYWRLALEWGMVNVLIADGDYPTALSRAKRLCDLTAQTDERTFQALAWEALARAALSCGEVVKAGSHVERALAACEGVQVPLAEWRVHATCAITFTALGDDRRVGTHTRLGAAARKRLAESLPEGHAVADHSTRPESRTLEPTRASNASIAIPRTQGRIRVGLCRRHARRGGAGGTGGVHAEILSLGDRRVRFGESRLAALPSSNQEPSTVNITGHHLCGGNPTSPLIMGGESPEQNSVPPIGGDMSRSTFDAALAQGLCAAYGA